MDLAEREMALERFRTERSVFVLLASSRVASEGLTLTEANHVIFFNEWWNPSANAQARDRVVRIGQRRGVRVYKFRCRKTIEEDLANILEEKRETFARVIDQLAESRLQPTRELSTALRDLRARLHLSSED
jgi:non-specific serine/threonine protein kinase